LRTRALPCDDMTAVAVANDLAARGVATYTALQGDCTHDFICEHGDSTFTVSLVDGADHRATVTDGVVTYSPELPDG